MKSCTRCKEIKPFTSFHRSKKIKDGHVSHCKECVSASHKQYYSKNKESVKKKRMLDYYGNRTEHSKRVRQWKRDNTEKVMGYDAAYKKRNPEKHQAHLDVRYAIARGDLIRMPCESCDDKDTHAHHDDYSKPLDVRWLCPQCHVNVHKQYAERT